MNIGMTVKRGMWLAAVLAATSVQAEWTQFRGPQGSGTVAGAKPPTEWSDAKNVQWKAALPGPGTSSPILVGGKIFLTCWSGNGATGTSSGPLKRHLVCVDRKSGKVLWSKVVAAEANVDRYDAMLGEHGYASHTPTSDGERVYVYFGKAGALAFDLEGQQLWQTNLGTGANQKNWGSASSPVLYKDFVIINASEESHAVYALDKKTGKQVWKAEGGGLEYVFGTPVLMETDGKAELLMALPNELWALNPDTGKLRWFAETGMSGNVAPSVVPGKGVVYAFGGFPQLMAVAVKTGGKGDVSQTHVLWRNNKSTYIPTPVLYQDRLYFASDAGFATCLDAKTGTVVYQERLPGASASGRGKPFYASAVLANGQVYAVSRRSGTFVFPASPEFKVVAQNKLTDDTQFNATPALDGQQIFLRSDRYLYCIATGAGGSAGE
jgi:outer membrane protein assembly factor BamB